MKKSFLFLVAMLMMAFSQSVRADELTVNDGTMTSSYSPIYTSYTDTKGAHSQFIQPATDLEDMIGATINSLKFYSSRESYAWTGVFSVRLLEVEGTSLSGGFADLTQATEVYNGILELANYEFTVQFTTPYQYQGGNLLVDFSMAVAGNYIYHSYYGVSAASGSGRYASSATANGSIISFLPKTTFEYMPGKVSCPRVENLAVSNVEAYSADLSWEGDAPEYEVSVNGVASIVTESRKALDLNAYTNYEVAVRAICAEGDTSSVRKITFRTPKTCAAPDSVRFSEADLSGHTVLRWNGDASMYYLNLKEGSQVLYSDRIGADSLELYDLTVGKHTFSVTLSAQCGAYTHAQSDTISTSLLVEVPMATIVAPYTESFESITSGVPFGWDNEQGTTTATTNRFASFQTGYQGRGVRFNSYSNSNGLDNYLVSPVILVPAAGYQLSFWAKNPTGGNYEVSLQVGDSTILLETNMTNLPDWTEKTYELDSLNLAGQEIRVVFHGVSNYGSDDAYLYLDEVCVEPVPTCFPVRNVRLDYSTYNSAIITWDAAKGEPDYAVVVMNGADTLFNQTVSENSITIANLEAYTSYTLVATVTSACSATDMSKPCTATLNFTTPIPPLTAPYYEGFESITTGVPAGWDNTQGTTTTASYRFCSYSTGYAGRGLRFNSFSNTRNLTNKLVSPAVLIPSTGYTMTFWYKNPTGGDVVASLMVEGNAIPVEGTFTGVTAWTQFVIDMDPYVGQTVQLVLDATSNYGSNDAYVYFDEFEINKPTTCFPATDIHITDIASNYVGLAWTAPEEGDFSYDVYIINGTDTTYTLINGNQCRIPVIPATYYSIDVIVITNCSVADGSEDSTSKPCSAHLTFTTECEVMTGNYFTDFESDANCWTLPTGVTRTAASSYSASGTYALKFATTSTVIAILPEVDPLAGKQFTFKHRREGTTNTTMGIIDAGYIIDASDASTFVALATYDTKPTSMTLETIFFDKDVPAGARAAFKYYNATSAGWYYFIDDVALEEIPTCFPVSNIHVVDSTLSLNSVSIAWTPAEQGGDNFAVCVLSGADTLYNGTVAGTELELTGLTPATSYSLQVSVATDCGDGDMAKATTATLNFLTECDVLTSYVTDFENDPASPACWDLDNGISVVTSSLYAYSGTRALQFATTNAVSAALPEVEDLNGMRLTVYYRNESTGTNTTSGYFLLGYMTYEKDSLDNLIETFVPVSDTVPQAFEMTELYADYQNVPAGAVAAIHYYGATNAGWYGFIDDVELVTTPTCFKVSHIRMVEDALTTNSATFEWTAGASETEYNVVAVVNGETMVETTVQDTIFTLEDLDHSSDYRVTLYVTSVCGADDLSKTASQTFSFTTPCGVNEVTYYDPFHVSFENLKADTIANQGCFGGYTVGGTSTWKATYDYQNGAYAKVNYAVDTVRTTAVLIMPTIGLKAGRNYELIYEIKGTNYQTEDTLAIYLNDNLVHAINAQEIGNAWTVVTDTISGEGACELRLEYSSFFGYSCGLRMLAVREIYEFRASTFEDVTVNENGLYRPDKKDGVNTWESGSQTFATYADKSEWGTYYYDVVVSSLKDSTFVADYTPGYDLKAACGAAAEGDNYAVWYNNWYSEDGISVALHQPEVLSGMYVTNNTYVVNSILNGDSYAKKFEHGDWLKLTVNGYVTVIDSITGFAEVEKVSSVDFMLADFTDETDYRYAVDWMWLDLTSLGEVQLLGFEMSSSDTGDWGMNTPAYFCFDNLGGAAPAKKADYRHIYNTPSQLYLIGDNQGWKPAEGVEMTQTEAGVFTIENVVMPNDNNWFAFTSVLSGDWAVVNAHRYGNADANILNNATSLVRAAEQCFTLAKGTYNLTVNFNTNTALAEEVKEPEGLNGNRVSEKAEKVLREGIIYIRKGGKTYTTVGQTISK